MTTASDQREIELKLALLPGQVPLFERLMARRHVLPVRQQLLTRYFDTPGFALSQQGLALRVRRAGRRWLQTLKTEGERAGGLSARDEYETPVARDALDWERFPPAAQERVPQALRAQLVPVFETRFERKAWTVRGQAGARIEVALDVGEVRAGERGLPLCEVELELKSGRPDALFALALPWTGQLDCLPLDASKAERGVRLAQGQSAAPVKSAPVALSPDMTVQAGMVAICRACLAQFQANLPGVLQDDDIEYVHQARVALRRLRAALRLYRRVCPLSDASLQTGLGALVAALGPARDWDVLCLTTLPAIEPSFNDRPAWQQLMQEMESRRQTVRQAMRAALREARPAQWLLAFHRWLAQPAGRELPDQGSSRLQAQQAWAGQAVQAGHRKIIRRSRDLGRLTPGQRHALRILLKRQRYAAEFFQTLYPSGRQLKYLHRLTALQDSLGLANDAQVARTLLTDAQGDAPCFALGFVQGWLTCQVREAAGPASAKDWKALTKFRPRWQGRAIAPDDG